LAEVSYVTEPKLSIETLVASSIVPEVKPEDPSPVKVSSPATTQNSPTPASYGVTLVGLKNLKNAARDKILADANRNAAINITQDNLMESWREVVEQIASEKMLYKSAILESELSFIEHEITIHANVVSFDFLKSERIQLLDFFKAHYHNEHINVLFKAKVINLDQKDEQVMSTREIFDMMAEKNPNLRILKDNLGLDIEY